MKVVFKLNNAQQQRAEAAVEAAQNEYEELTSSDYDSKDVILSGNAWCILEHSFGWNPNQTLNYDSKSKTLTLAGERNAILADGLLDVVKSIIGDGPEDVLEYESSVKSLKWDECLTSNFWCDVESHSDAEINELRKKLGDELVLEDIRVHGRSAISTEIAIRVYRKIMALRPGSMEYIRAAAEGSLPSASDLKIAAAIQILALTDESVKARL